MLDLQTSLTRTSCPVGSSRCVPSLVMQASRTHPVDALIGRAKELISVRRYGDALRLLDSAGDVNDDHHHAASSVVAPSSAAFDTAARSNAVVLYRAFVLHELGRCDAALAAASALMQAELTEADAAQRDAILMRCSMRLRLWRRCTEYAERLMLQPNDHLAVEALCTLGRVTVTAWNRPEAAGNFFQQALERDPSCAAAWDAIVDQWLLLPARQRALLDTLTFPPFAECQRHAYAARIALHRDPALSDESAVGAPPQAFDPPATLEVGVPAFTTRYARARRHYYGHALREALGEVSAALAEAPENIDALVLKLAILVDLRATNDLFEFAHRVADELKPSPAVASYAIGCYHFSVAAFDTAGRYFSKSTEADAAFAPAWVAYGNCYARLEEGEQALNAYRRAQAIFPCFAALRTYIGMQHLRSGNGQLGLCFLEEAEQVDPNDPLTLNELGVHALRYERDLDAALHFFTAARDALPNREQPSEYHDCVLFNLATVLRRLGHHDQALQHFLHYVRVRPYAVAGHSGLALTYHVMGNLRAAIHHYHVALGLKPDTVCRELLEKALAEEMSLNADANFAPVDGGADWGEGDSGAGYPHHHQQQPQRRGHARVHDPLSPGAATPHFSLSAISRIARSESQAPPFAEGASPVQHHGSAVATGTAARPAAGINRALAF
jgi:anaphase-promoting complex subunit 6